jgi:hypothetical protein
LINAELTYIFKHCCLGALSIFTHLNISFSLAVS